MKANFKRQNDCKSDNMLKILVSTEEGAKDSQIYIDLNEGWNIIGYTLSNPQDVVQTLATISSEIKIIKNNDGQFYWPEMGPTNQIGDFIPGEGYQIKLYSQILDYTYPIIEE